MDYNQLLPEENHNQEFNNNQLGKGLEALIPKKEELSFNSLDDQLAKKISELNDPVFPQERKTFLPKETIKEDAFDEEDTSVLKNNSDFNIEGEIKDKNNVEDKMEENKIEDDQVFREEEKDLEKGGIRIESFQENNQVQNSQSQDLSSLEETFSNDQEEEEKENINALMEEKIFYIETDKIKPNPYQPRKIFSEESLKELADSIKEYGILEPLVALRVEKETETGTTVEYQLISGERRLMAAKLLNLPTVPVIIRKPIEEQKQLELALIENIQREDLDPISKAQAFYKLINEFNLTQQELAQRIGKSRELIANTLRLLQLPLEAQNALKIGKINEAHARALLLFNQPEKRRIFLKEILAKNLSGREALDLAQKLTGDLGTKKTKERRRNVSLEPEDIELKEKLEEALGTPVYIKKKGEQGAIEIKFYSQKDLEKILGKILSF